MTWNFQLIIGPDDLIVQGPPPDDGLLSVAVYNDEMHVCYPSPYRRIGFLGPTGLIQDVWYDGATGQWNLQQLAGPGGLVGGPPAAWFGGPVAATYNNQMHVIYWDTNRLIWDAWNDSSTGQWNLQQLTGSGGLTGGPQVTLWPAVVTYNNQMHVCYCDSNNLIWDAWYDGATGQWNLQQLTGSGGLTNGPPAANLLSLNAYNNQMHVFYPDANGLTWDAWYDGATGQWDLWQLAGPGGLAGGPAAGVGCSPVTVNFNNRMHVCYMDNNGLIHDAQYNGATNQWNLQQINGSGGLTNGPPSKQGIPYLSVVVYNNQMHAFYCDWNEQIWDVWYDSAANQWNLQQITGSAGLTDGPPNDRNLVAVTFNNQMHVCYGADNGAICEVIGP